MRKNITETPRKSTEPQSAQRELNVGIDWGTEVRLLHFEPGGRGRPASAVATTKKDLSRVFGTLRPSRLALEVGRTRRG